MRLSFDKVIFLVVIASTMYAVLSIVSAMFPDEEIPRVVFAANGARTYVIESLRATALLPIGTVLFWGLLIALTPIMLRRQRIPLDAEYGPLRRCLGWIGVCVCVLPFLAITVAVVIISPYRDYRKATVGPEAIAFSSLYSSWTIPMSEVQDVKLIRNERVVTQKRLVDLHLVITTRDNREFRSVQVDGLGPRDRALKEYLAVFDSFAEDVRTHKGGKEQKVEK